MHIIIASWLFAFKVNNAGILEVGSIENTSLEQYDNVMNVNVRYEYNNVAYRK